MNNLKKEVYQFIDSYVQTLLTTSCENKYTHHDLANETVSKSIQDCCDFLMLAKGHINRRITVKELGKQFWLTRNNESNFKNNKKLKEIAQSFGDVVVQVGIDGKLRY